MSEAHRTSILTYALSHCPMDRQVRLGRAWDAAAMQSFARLITNKFANKLLWTRGPGAQEHSRRIVFCDASEIVAPRDGILGLARGIYIEQGLDTIGYLEVAWNAGT